MSSTGARKKRTSFDIAIESLRDTNNADIQNMKRFSAESSPIAGAAGAASTNSATPGGSFLNIAGETPMIGAIAFNPVAVIIDDGSIDIGSSDIPPQKYSTYVLVTGQGTPDDLNYIDNALNNGQLLYYQGTITQIQNIKHASIGTISNIVGTVTVTVTTTIPHNMTTGDRVTIQSTTNFNISKAVITVTGGSTFTYSATGSVSAETSGVFQNGNVLTSDGTTLTLDGTVTANAVPWIALLFDPTVLGGGAWRVQFGAGSGGTNLLPLNNTWTGSNTFNGSPFIINGAITTLASVTSTSITSPLIVLGDSSSDDLQIVATPTFLAGVLFSNTVTMNGSITNINSANINLGDAITDTINFSGRIGTDIIPILDADDDLGTNVLRWDNIFGVSVIANTVTASVSLSSTGTTTLGDDAADNIFFGGQIATQMVIEEISVPGTPPANTVTLYAKDDGGTSSLFFKDDAGAEFNLNATGGSGANTALSNLASVAINTSLLPAGDGTLNLGSAAFSWLDTFTERIRIETGGVSTSTANQIIADAGGMIFNVPAADRYEFNISGSPNGIAIEEDRIQFLTTGRQHRIDVQSTAIEIIAENTTDSVNLWTGAARSNETVEVLTSITTFKTTDSSSGAYRVRLLQNNNTPIIQNAIGAIEGFSENTSSTDVIFGRVEFSTADSVTAASHNGRIQMEISSNGNMVPVIEITGYSGGARLGFFGVTEVARQNPASDTLANLYTAFRNYGLLV